MCEARLTLTHLKMEAESLLNSDKANPGFGLAGQWFLNLHTTTSPARREAVMTVFGVFAAV